MDYSKELKEILKEVKEVRDDAKNSKDYVTYNQMIDKLYKGLELIARLTGDIKTKVDVNYDIKVIYNEINNDIERQMSILNDNKSIDVEYEIVEEDKKEFERINEAK